MGCGISKDENYSPENAKEVWAQLEAKSKIAGLTPEKLIRPHNDWKTVRLFVCSTFKDFRNERELLHEKGNHDENIDPNNIILFLDSLEQGYQENQCVFFLGLLGECAGYIPPSDCLEEETCESFGVVPGLSLLEMEIILGVYRGDNPNALFMARDPKFLNSIPFHKPQFIEDESGRKRIAFLKQKLSQKIPMNRMITYYCTAEGVVDKRTDKMIRVTNLERFLKQVAEFFKKRIEHQYPVVHGGDINEPTGHQRIFDHFQENTLPHNKATDTSIEKIMAVLAEDKPNCLVLKGSPGLGRSKSMASLIQQLLPCRGSSQSALKCAKAKDKAYQIFYHFAGLATRGTDTNAMLRRLLVEVYGVNVPSLPQEPEKLRAAVFARLMNPSSVAVIILIDDADALDEANPFSWMPENPAPQVRLLLSVGHKSSLLARLEQGMDSPLLFTPPFITKQQAKAEINLYLHHVPRGAVPGIKPKPPKSAQHHKIHQKNLDDVEDQPDVARPKTKRRLVADELIAAASHTQQTIGQTPRKPLGIADRINSASHSAMDALRQRHASVHDIEEMAPQESNNLGNEAQFTTTKCRIMATMLRWGASFDLVKALAPKTTEKVAEVELLEFESNELGHLYIPTLCLLAASKEGLREIELRYLLADEAKLLPDGVKRRHNRLGFLIPTKSFVQIPPLKWRDVAVRLSHHLIDCGKPGENRFRILDDACKLAVIRRYLKKTEGIKWWHGKLASFFERNMVILRDRRAEELPHHLIALKQPEKLLTWLIKWEIVDDLFADNMGSKLLELWEEHCGSVQKMEQPYLNVVMHQLAEAADSINILQIEKATERAEMVANLFNEAGLHDAALRMMERSIEIVKSTEKPSPTHLGRLYLIQGEILHKRTTSTNGLLEWVESEEANAISTIIHVFEAALDQLNIAEDTANRKFQIALGNLHLAFWNMWKEKLSTPNTDFDALPTNKEENLGESKDKKKPFKAAIKLANEAKELYQNMKNYLGQADAYILRAQCNTKLDKVAEDLTKAEERIHKYEGPFSSKLLQVYALNMKLTGSVEAKGKAENLCRALYQYSNPEKCAVQQAVIHELST